MKNLAPKIIRQRLLIEAKYTINVDKEIVKKFLLNLTKELNLKTYGKISIHSTSGEGKQINQGFDAFVPLIDSGISLYVWQNEKFISCIIYSCKNFSTEKAVQFTNNFFKAKEIVHEEF